MKIKLSPPLIAGASMCLPLTAFPLAAKNGVYIISGSVLIPLRYPEIFRVVQPPPPNRGTGVKG